MVAKDHIGYMGGQIPSPVHAPSPRFRRHIHRLRARLRIAISHRTSRILQHAAKSPVLVSTLYQAGAKEASSHVSVDGERREHDAMVDIEGCRWGNYGRSGRVQKGGEGVGGRAEGRHEADVGPVGDDAVDRVHGSLFRMDVQVEVSPVAGG